MDPERGLSLRAEETTRAYQRMKPLVISISFDATDHPISTITALYRMFIQACHYFFQEPRGRRNALRWPWLCPTFRVPLGLLTLKNAIGMSYASTKGHC